ncbi:MAG: transcriptional regulator GcvA [Gammaproteobacteria bacterium]|jgi:LysR family glycine cleavage system transcriptional activator|nr:transcriptional regulator GcvA [Gammaproteobacteria bacterium]
MKLPIHLNGLRAFEASARHQSFSAAAEELNVTSAAVGQLVRSLEDVLGTALFIRSTSGRLRLIPTEVAEMALPDLRAGFERLAIGLQQLQNGVGSEDLLTVTVSPAFAAKWLLPRIERFQQQWPEINVRLDTSLKPVDFKAQRVDVGVRYGSGSWPGLVSEKLMAEEVFPVCSPTLLTTHPDDLNLALSDLTLIHDLSMDSHSGFPTWQRWLANAGCQQQNSTRSMQINNSAAVLQAAIDGHGVALARSVMAHDDLVSGRLVRLWPHIQYASSLAYYLVYRTECSNLAKIQAFRSWLRQEVDRSNRQANAGGLLGHTK